MFQLPKIPENKGKNPFTTIEMKSQGLAMQHDAIWTRKHVANFKAQ